MKREELRIGDWVLKDLNYYEEDPNYTRLNYQPFKIETGEDIDLACETNCIGDADVYQPMPLTEEILLKNGLHGSKKEGHMSCLVDIAEGDWWSVQVNFNEEWMTEKGWIKNIRVQSCSGAIFNEMSKQTIGGRIFYVHELQHLMEDAGIEKEIVV